MSETEAMVLGAVRSEWSTVRDLVDRIVWSPSLSNSTKDTCVRRYLDRAVGRGEVECELVEGVKAYRLPGPSRTEAPVRAMLSGVWASTRAIADAIPAADRTSDANHLGWVRRTLESLVRYGVAEKRVVRDSGRAVLEWRLAEGDPPEERPLRRFEGRPYADDIRRAVISYGPLCAEDLLVRLGVDPRRKGTISAVRSFIRHELKTGSFLEEDGLLRWNPRRVVPVGQVRSECTEELIRRAFDERGPMDVVTLSDMVGVSPSTARKHLHRMGAAISRKDNRTVIWTLPEEEAER